MYSKLIELEACAGKGGTYVECGGKQLAVFLKDDGKISVVDNACPHAGGDLSQGELTENEVSCPWHQWEFDLKTGVSKHSAFARIRVYPTKIENGVVYADLDNPVTPPPPDAPAT